MNTRLKRIEVRDGGFQHNEVDEESGTKHTDHGGVVYALDWGRLPPRLLLLDSCEARLLLVPAHEEAQDEVDASLPLLGGLPSHQVGRGSYEKAGEKVS